ncbi:MAG: DUF3024 domain-containing protein [Bacteroidetes bacterium]|nr:DUF3024 domain-containing protein [Bacteroidota bacterium]
MPISDTQLLEIIHVGETFLEKRRSPEELRNQIDIGYRIDGQYVFIYETRPKWTNPSDFKERDIAKVTFVQTQNVWNVFWMNSNLKWIGYKPIALVKTIK